MRKWRWDSTEPGKWERKRKREGHRPQDDISCSREAGYRTSMLSKGRESSRSVRVRQIHKFFHEFLGGWRWGTSINVISSTKKSPRKTHMDLAFLSGLISENRPKKSSWTLKLESSLWTCFAELEFVRDIAKRGAILGTFRFTVFTFRAHCPYLVTVTWRWCTSRQTWSHTGGTRENRFWIV